MTYIVSSGALNSTHSLTGPGPSGRVAGAAPRRIVLASLAICFLYYFH